MLSINTNIFSLNAQRNLSQNQLSLSTSMSRLSSGLRINSAGDDAAGLAIATRMGAQVNGLNQSVMNANNAISLLQTAGGTLTTITNNLQTIRDLAVQASTATNSPSDLSAMNTEAQQLLSEINRAAQTAQYNGINLLDGSFSNKSFQVGAFAGQSITVTSIASALTGGSTSTGSSYTGAVTTAALVASSLAINGVTIGSSVDGLGVQNSTGFGLDQTSDSAWAIANAINAANTGATATANVVTATAAAVTFASAIVAGSVKINGLSIGSVSGAADNYLRQLNIASAINAVSNQTGVTASVIASGASGSVGYLSLTNAEGGDVTLADANADTGVTVGTTRGTITLNSASGEIVVGSAATGGQAGGPGEAGFTDATYTNPGGSTAGTGTGLGVAGLSVLTQTAAGNAITSIDAALSIINTSQANLGAYQNRFSSVVATLQNASQNLSAAKSGIMDADYAAETANMTKAMITQQAGISVLAQANTLPQYILSLLPK